MSRFLTGFNAEDYITGPTGKTYKALSLAGIDLHIVRLTSRIHAAELKDKWSEYWGLYGDRDALLDRRFEMSKSADGHAL